MKKFVKAVVFTIGILLVACGPSSRITSSWKAPDIQQKYFNKILVLGLINEPDRTLREEMEKHLVNDLNNLGYNAVCSCNEFDPKAFEHMSESEAVAKITGTGVDAVLTIVLLDKTKERYYLPGRIYYSPYVIYHRRFWGYYSSLYSRVYAPGYYTTDTKYFWESNLYDLSKDKELLYSVQTRSFDPASTGSLAEEYGKIIVNDLVKNNVLSKEPKLKAY
jgi:hypothetical protein